MRIKTVREVKRFFDIFASGLGLLILSPLFIVVAIWIKLDSRGPVFYRFTSSCGLGGTIRISIFTNSGL